MDEREVRRIVREEITRVLTAMHSVTIRDWGVTAAIERGISEATGVYYLIERIDRGHAEWLTPDYRWTTDVSKARRFDHPSAASPWLYNAGKKAAGAEVTVTGHMDCAGPDLSREVLR
jgi:hypothetical protein